MQPSEIMEWIADVEYEFFQCRKIGNRSSNSRIISEVKTNVNWKPIG